jgi:glycosyltransferase involved in cell wall biosynthesis
LDKHLHIICFDVPYPADYGGVIDVFYKIVWLQKAGIKIHLHCFANGRKPNNELDKYCETVNYYTRTKGISFSLPYIVKSRSSKALAANIVKDNYPILMEGIHCTYLLNERLFADRKILIRLHNVEHKYYSSLAKNESNGFKKFYFFLESRLLKKYESTIANKAILLALNKQDQEYYVTNFESKQTHFLPAFLPWDTVNIASGKGAYCLYHGNLSVNENETAAIWLVNEVFNSLEIPLIIAGKNPSQKLQNLIKDKQHIKLIANPGEAEINELIKNAQLNILPSFNNTGVKLKLLNALFNGRYCVSNIAAVAGSLFSELTIIASSANDFTQKIENLFTQEFTEAAIELRQNILSENYSNKKNIEQLIAWIY